VVDGYYREANKVFCGGVVLLGWGREHVVGAFIGTFVG